MVRPLKMALVSTMYSPFQVALTDALNARDDVQCRSLFTMTRSGARGKHWTAGMQASDSIQVAPEWSKQRELTQWIGDRLCDDRPDIIVTTGILRSNSYRAMVALRRKLTGTPIGLWLEHPNFAVPRPRRLLMEAAIRAQLRTVDYVLAIGDRAEKFYQRCHPSLPVYVVPYGQDLDPLFAVERTERPPVTTFLFSGQLVHRNNIDGLCRALRMLATTHPSQFRFIMAAYGPEENRVRQLMQDVPQLDNAITFDTEYETWEDRIRPFRNADVLVCPSRHAGWALVVPEAMAAAMPVIATRYVNAARYYVRPEVNGLICDLNPASIHRRMARFIDDPNAIERMGAAARQAASAGTAAHVAGLMTAALKRRLAAP
jgi:glycosyltransferase involved in cell wall biosynthesis